MKKILFYLTSAVIFTATFTACTAEITTLPAGVTLNQSSVTLSPGESLTLTADVMPDEAAIKTLTWSSSNPAIATVDHGVVTAITEGTAAITVTTNSGQKMTACEVTVAYPVSGVMLDKASALLPFGQNLRLTATVMPDDAPDKTITWISSDPSVATVANGIVTAKAAGTAIISVITGIGSRIASTTIKVLPENAKMITMAFSSESVRINMSGSGEVDIDWGDYEFVTYTLLGFALNYSHNYNSGSLPRTVTIASENITRLICTANQISGLDVSKCTTLTTLNCSDNLLTGLDVSNNTSLVELNCSNNPLTGLDVSNNTALKNLNCAVNQLSGLNVSNNAALTELICTNNQLTTLDVSNNTALKNLNCAVNQLSGLDVSNNAALNVLDCSHNILTKLNTSTNSALSKLNCSHNELSVHTLNGLFDMLPVVSEGFLDFGNNPGAAGCNKSIAENKGWNTPRQMFLTLEGAGMVNLLIAGSGNVEIDWGDGSLETSNISLEYFLFRHTYVNITSYTIIITGENITSMSCYNNRLTNLDVRNNPVLSFMNCSDNLLTGLDVSKNTAMIGLGCSNNLLTSLDLNNNTRLHYVYCDNNQLSADALNAFFISLHSNNVNGGFKWIYMQNNPGTNTCDQSIARNKGWIFQ